MPDVTLETAQERRTAGPESSGPAVVVLKKNYP
jgi:hypothetical protein